MDKVDFEFKINNKNYNEYYARYLLEGLYGDAFKDARIADRPDIWVEGENGGIGVEVTTLLDTYYNTLKKYKKVWAKKGLTLEQITRSIPSLLKNKIGINSYGNLVLIGNEKRHSISKSLKGLETTIRTKLNKMQHYRQFESLNLFIFATNLSPDCSIENIHEMLKKIDKSKYPNTFDSIMIFNYDTIQIFPFKIIGKPEIYQVNDETRLYCDKLAEIEQTRIATAYDEKQKQKKELLKLQKSKKPQNENPEKEST